MNEQRYERLARGINLPFWFWYGPVDVDEIRALYTAADFAQIQALGFTWVRVPVDIEFLLDTAHPNHVLHKEHLAVFDKALDLMLGADLMVMIDMHNMTGSQLRQNGHLDDTFVQVWEAFAKHLKKRDPERVILEPLNEPVFYEHPEKWASLQQRLIAAIRRQAPHHTIVATSARWSQVDTLVQLEPLDDPNLLYNFHFYDPLPFTHQGATWSRRPAMKNLAGLPFPSSVEEVQPVIAELDDPEAVTIARDYGEREWDAEKLAALLTPLVEWRQQHGVRLVCNGFGAYRKFAPPEDRARWVRTVRQLLEGHGIGWALWEYDGGFGMAKRDENGRRQVDPSLVEALGLPSVE